MAESGLDSLRETHPLTIQWKAYELRPEGSPPMPPEYRERILAGWPRVQQMARERFNVEMTRPGLKNPGDTFLAHTGGKFAERQGLGEAYHKAVFRAHWQTEQDIADPETLTKIAGEVGLDETAFRQALADPELAAEVRADEHWAMQNGLNGVPAFIFGNRYLVSGAQPVEVLRQVADRCIQEGLVDD
ncbi:MAG: DsbA family oxidoreductase [Anaerolineales bacterium]|nr:DsbA family oxidoreductase [Anaerolineales bacterium]